MDFATVSSSVSLLNYIKRLPLLRQIDMLIPPFSSSFTLIDKMILICFYLHFQENLARREPKIERKCKLSLVLQNVIVHLITLHAKTHWWKYESHCKTLLIILFHDNCIALRKDLWLLQKLLKLKYSCGVGRTKISAQCQWLYSILGARKSIFIISNRI